MTEADIYNTVPANDKSGRKSDKLIADNLEILAQVEKLAKQIDVSDYPSYAVVGPHFRHIIEHYETFVQQYDSGVINYDLRNRNQQIESCCATMQRCLQKVKTGLYSVDWQPLRQLCVQCATCVEPVASSAFSTAGRELMFLHSHTTHHLAIISLQLRGASIEIDSDIGVAPATLRYRDSVAVGAGQVSQ